MAQKATPMEDAIRSKVWVDDGRPVRDGGNICSDFFQITAALSPTLLEIYNDSHLHAHHKAMEGSSSREVKLLSVHLEIMYAQTRLQTHFRVYIATSAFASKFQPARHRMVYSLLKDEMSQEGGIHALQLRTRTPEEEERIKQHEIGRS
jgi:BolA protein